MSGMVQRRKQVAEESQESGGFDDKKEDNYNLTLMEEILLLGLKDSEVCWQ
jgi:hypothetical protein